MMNSTFKVRALLSPGSFHSDPEEVKIRYPNWQEEFKSLLKWASSCNFNTFALCYTLPGLWKRWRHPGNDYKKFIKEICNLAKEKNISIMQMVNPYDGIKEDSPRRIRISNDRDIEALVETFKISLRCGADKIMLCLDDFASKGPPYRLINPQDKARFRNLAEAHIFAANQLYERIKKDYPAAKIYFCQSYYWWPVQKANHAQEAEKYLRLLGKGVHQDVVFVYTGHWDIFRGIRTGDTKQFIEMIGRKPMLWDNDTYIYQRKTNNELNLFPYARPKNLFKYSEGIIIWTPHYYAPLDFFFKRNIISQADYIAHPRDYNPGDSFRRSLSLFLKKNEIKNVLRFNEKNAEVALLKERLMAVKGMKREEILEKISRRLKGLKKIAGKIAHRQASEGINWILSLHERFIRLYLKAEKLRKGNRKKISKSQIEGIQKALARLTYCKMIKRASLVEERLWNELEELKEKIK